MNQRRALFTSFHRLMRNEEGDVGRAGELFDFLAAHGIVQLLHGLTDFQSFFPYKDEIIRSEHIKMRAIQVRLNTIRKEIIQSIEEHGISFGECGPLELSNGHTLILPQRGIIDIFAADDVQRFIARQMRSRGFSPFRQGARVRKLLGFRFPCLFKRNEFIVELHPLANQTEKSGAMTSKIDQTLPVAAHSELIWNSFFLLLRSSMSEYLIRELFIFYLRIYCYGELLDWRSFFDSSPGTQGYACAVSIYAIIDLFSINSDWSDTLTRHLAHQFPGIQRHAQLFARALAAELTLTRAEVLLKIFGMRTFTSSFLGGYPRMG